MIAFRKIVIFIITDLQIADHLQCNAKQPFGTGPVFKTGILSYKVLAEGEGVKTVYEVSIKEPPVSGLFGGYC